MHAELASRRILKQHNRIKNKRLNNHLHAVTPNLFLIWFVRCGTENDITCFELQLLDSQEFVNRTIDSWPFPVRNMRVN